MESKEQKAIRLLTELVGFQNGAPLDRHKEEYDKLMNDIYAFIDSHSPTEPEFDTLQEGDYAPNLSKEQYDHLIKIEGDTCVLEYVEGYGLAFVNGILVDDNYPHVSRLKTQLAPEEFLRRAENTFNKK